MTRAITAPELALLRSDRQVSRFGLAIHKPITVWSAISSMMSSNDMVAAVGYTGASGTLANVLPGMTCWVGSSAGAYDLGMLRVRKAPDATYVYLSETSTIDWSTSHYLTVVDEFRVWPCLPMQPDEDPDSIRMDYDVVYSDQHSVFDPVPVLGPDWVLYGSLSVSPDASGSWVPGSTIASYAWTATGSPTITDATSATPGPITWSVPGVYRITCTVTAANGKTATGHRLVFIYSDAVPPLVYDVGYPNRSDFSVANCEGSIDNGWGFDLTVYGDARQALLRPGARCILFAINESYGTTAGSLGPITGHENIICAGWLGSETAQADPRRESPAATWRVYGTARQMSNIHLLTTQVSYSAGAPSSWRTLQGLTVDRGLWHILTKRSNVYQVVDIYLPGSSKLLPQADCAEGSLKSQLDSLAAKIMAKACSNRYGQLYVFVPPNHLPVASRSALPVVMALTTADYMASIEITISDSPVTNLFDVSGSMYDGATETPLLARSPGNVPHETGTPGSADGLLASSQADLNAMCGILAGEANNPLPAVSINLAANNRFADVCPAQYLTLSIDAADAGQRITWTDERLIPRAMSFDLDFAKGFLTTRLDCTGESTPENAVMVPVLQPTQWDFYIPPLPTGFSIQPFGLTFPDLVIPTDPETGGYAPYYNDPADDPNQYAAGDLILQAPPRTEAIAGAVSQDRSDTSKYGLSKNYNGNTDFYSYCYYLYPGESTPAFSCKSLTTGLYPIAYPDSIISMSADGGGDLGFLARLNADYFIGYAYSAGFDGTLYDLALRFTTLRGAVLDIPLTYYATAPYAGTHMVNKSFMGNFSQLLTAVYLKTIQFVYLDGPNGTGWSAPEDHWLAEINTAYLERIPA